ncbi:MAG: gamma-glutamylcyclotransferase [Methylomicrobium sp.]|nr:gamma-glutamylcyclotransferase [Methylomicrobium sp.]
MIITFVMTGIYTVFAYGSLIHPGSLARTVPTARNRMPVSVKGLKRQFNLASTYRYDPLQQLPVCVLNAEASEPDAVLNGICFDLDESELDALLEREKGYDFCPVDARHFFDESLHINAYYFNAKNYTPYRYLTASKEQAHYLSICLQGCTEFGEAFVDAFKASTGFWGIDNDMDIDAIWQGAY